jgi:hypothetical protein
METGRVSGHVPGLQTACRSPRAVDSWKNAGFLRLAAGGGVAGAGGSSAICNAAWHFAARAAEAGGVAPSEPSFTIRTSVGLLPDGVTVAQGILVPFV